MQKQYVIGYTAPAIHIALQLAHRQFVVPRSPRQPADPRRARVVGLPLALIAFAIVSVSLAMIAVGPNAIGICLAIGFFAAASGTLLNARNVCDDQA